MAGEVGSLKATLEFDLGDAKSVLDDFRGSLDEIVDKLNERLSLEVDAGGATSALDDAIGKADQFKDTADSLKGTEISADSSGFTSAVDSAGSSTDALSGQLAGLKSTIDTAFDIAVVAAFAAAIWEAGDAVMGLAEQFATMQDASQRAAMFGNTAMGDMQARTAQIMEQADIAAVKYGVPSEQVAGMIGTFAQFGTTQLSQDQINAAVGASRGMQLEPADLARGIQSAYTTTQKAYSQQDLLDMFSRAYMTTGLQPTTQISTALSKLQPMAGELGGVQGELAALMYGSQIMPGGRGVNTMVTGLESFNKQLNETYLTVDSKGKAVIKGSEDIYNAFTQAGLSFTQEQARGPLQALNDLYNAGQRMGKDFFTQAFGGQAGIMEALGAGLPAIQEYRSILQDSGGATEELATKVDDLQMSLDRMDEAFGNMGEAAGSLTEGPLRSMADFVAGPLLNGFNNIIDKLKSGDIKGALREAFDLGDIILKAPIEGLENFRNQILSFDWRDLGHTVASILGDSMSQINIDASELGKTVAAGLAAALDFARGASAFSWDILFGKTPIDAFLKPLETVVRAEFKLIAAEMALSMKEGSVGAVQAIYDFHDNAVTAIAGVMASVQMLAVAFSSGLVGAINDASTAMLGFKLIPTTGAGATPAAAASSSVSSGVIPSVSAGTDLSRAMDEQARRSQEFENKSDEAGALLIQSVGGLKSYADRLSRMTGLPVEIAPAQLMGTGYTAQWEGPVADVVYGAKKEYADLWGEIKQDWNNMDWGAFFGTPGDNLITGRPSFHGLDEETNTNFIKMNEAIEDTGGKSQENTAAIIENTEGLKTWDQYNRENIDRLGGLLGKYEPDLSKEREDVSIAQRLLNDALEGLKSKTNQLGDSFDTTKDKVDALGESSKTAAQAAQESAQALGRLKAITNIDEMGPDSFRSAVEGLGTMFAPSIAAPTLLYNELFEGIGPEPVRLGYIGGLSDEGYQNYLEKMNLLQAKLAGLAEPIPVSADVSQATTSIAGVQQDVSRPQTMPVKVTVSGETPPIGGASQFSAFGAEYDAQRATQYDLWKSHTGPFTPDASGDIWPPHGTGYDYLRQIIPDQPEIMVAPVVEAMAKVRSDAEKGIPISISGDTSDADAKIIKLGDTAGLGADMPIKLGGYESARAKMDNLTQDEYKYIYIITVKMSSGGGVGSKYMDLLANAEYSATGALSGIPYSGTPGMSIMDIPSFQHEGFVPRATLAMVGDRPGGEYVLSAERVHGMARGAGGVSSLTLNADLNINAPIYGVSDLEDRFLEHTREIEQLMNHYMER